MATMDSNAICPAKTAYGKVLAICRTIVREYRRAVAAEEYYWILKEESSGTPAFQGICRDDIPRRVFESFCSFKVDAEHVRESNAIGLGASLSANAASGKAVHMTGQPVPGSRH